MNGVIFLKHYTVQAKEMCLLPDLTFFQKKKKTPTLVSWQWIMLRYVESAKLIFLFISVVNFSNHCNVKAILI